MFYFATAQPGAGHGKGQRFGPWPISGVDGTNPAQTIRFSIPARKLRPPIIERETVSCPTRNKKSAAILIGIVLGPLVEENYIRALRIAEGDPMVLFSSDLGNILWAFLFISITLPYLIAYLKRRKARLKAASD